MPGHSPRVRMASSHHAWMGYGLLVVTTPTVVSAAGADAHPRFGPILFSLSVLVLAAKAGGLLAERWRQPPVLGELLAAIVLWLMRARLWQNRTALVLGVVAGSLYALWHWRHLSRRITRRHRRFERNKIFVHYLNTGEVLLSAVAYNPYLAIPIGVLLFVGVLLAVRSGAWWATLIAAFGLTSCGVLAGCIIGYERLHGPLHYQDDSRMWSGAEGMLYRTATVVKPLTPAGTVDYQGELWNAVSMSGDPIDAGDRVEVISVERLTLYVDHVPPYGPSAESL